ncbi:MAG: winged helix-turn-helix transcriptional regulator [Proteobacteria bacterium]|nr:winged helix-turn-helix transcriptional regulator [Pseudomonadota bacterium]
MSKSPDGAFLDAINLSRNSTVQLYHQIYDTLRSLIISGELASGTRIPSTRELMYDLKVSRTTVRHAFDQLIAEGYLSSR